MIIHLLAVVALQASSGDHVVVFDGSEGGQGDVRMVPRQGGGPGFVPAGLQGVQLLPIDFAGRTEFEEFRPDRPRLHLEISGAGRLHLPGAAGSLYRYKRGQAGGGFTFGFLHVDGDGTARAVGAQPGSGSSQDIDPFVERVAVAPDGLGVLVATTLSSGGDLLELDLTSGTLQNRTAGIAPQNFHGAGLWMHAAWGTAVSSAGIWRFDRAVPGTASAVAFAGAAPAWFARELVMSSNGAFAMTIAGAGPTAAHVYVYPPSGAAERVSAAPGTLPGAGFLPEFIDGPYLAVSDDGAACAWVATEAGTDELYLVARDSAGAWPAALHVTEDAIFDPFIDEIGEFIFTPSRQLVFAAGDTINALTGGIALLDYFRAEVLSTGSLNVFNLSQSYGQLQPPFTFYSTLEPEWTALTPALDTVLVHTTDAAGDRILSYLITGHSGSPGTLVLDEVEEVERVDMQGYDYLLTVSRSTQAFPEVYGYIWDFSAPTFVLPVPEDAPMISQANSAGTNGLVTDPGEIGHLWRIQPSSGTATLFTNKMLEYGPTLWNAPTGELLFTVDWFDQKVFLVRWNSGGGYKRIGTFAEAFILPGS